MSVPTSDAREISHGGRCFLGEELSPPVARDPARGRSPVEGPRAASRQQVDAPRHLLRRRARRVAADGGDQGDVLPPNVPATIKGLGELFTEGYAGSCSGTLQQLGAGIRPGPRSSPSPSAFVMGRFRIAEDMLAPYVNTLFVTSKESLLPIIIIAFGVASGTARGSSSCSRCSSRSSTPLPACGTSTRSYGRPPGAFGTGPWRMFTRVYLPAAAPFVVAGDPPRLRHGHQGHGHRRAVGPDAGPGACWRPSRARRCGSTSTTRSSS